MNLLRRSGKQDAIKSEPERSLKSRLSKRSLIHKLGAELVMLALGRFIFEHRLYNVSITEIEGGVVLQGLSEGQDDEFGAVSFLQTHVLGEAELRAMVDRLS
jgi:hypothetical protein